MEKLLVQAITGLSSGYLLSKKKYIPAAMLFSVSVGSTFLG